MTNSVVTTANTKSNNNFLLRSQFGWLISLAVLVGVSFRLGNIAEKAFLPEGKGEGHATKNNSDSINERKSETVPPCHDDDDDDDQSSSSSSAIVVHAAIHTKQDSTTSSSSLSLLALLQDEDTTFFDDDLLLQKVKASRQSRRPYGRYCSTNVINEQQLWPFARKKVISFSLFHSSPSSVLSRQQRGNKKKRPYESYLNGFKANVKGAALYYPEWTVRVFTFDLSDEKIDDLIKVDPSRVEVVICHDNDDDDDNDDDSSPNTTNTTTMVTIKDNNQNGTATNSTGNINIQNKNPLAQDSYSVKAATRFFAYDDPSVWVMLSRDTDSRFSPRELLAVNEWLATATFNDNDNNHNNNNNRYDDYCFHTMRDHVNHLGRPVLAGMFGIKRGCLNNGGHNNNSKNHHSITSLMDAVVQDQYPKPLDNIRAFDQYWLQNYVWPIVKNRTMAHDFHVSACGNTGAALCLPFPLGSVDGSGPRNSKKDYFVGQPMRSERDMNSPGYTCTLECQPEEIVKKTTTTTTTIVEEASDQREEEPKET